MTLRLGPAQTQNLGISDFCADVDDIELNIVNRRCLTGHNLRIYHANFSQHEANKMISISQDGCMIIWDCYKAMKMYAIPAKSCWCMCCDFSNKDDMIVSGGLDNIILVHKYDKYSDQYDAVSEMCHHQGYISKASFIKDDQIISSSGDSTCIVWDVERECPSLHLKGHSKDVNSFSLNKDLNCFISCSLDTFVKLWDLRDSRPQMSIRCHKEDINDVAFFPGGDFFGTACDDLTSCIFDVRMGKCIATYSAGNGGLTSICFSSSGRLSFLASSDSNIYCFDILKQKLLGVLTGHSNKVSGVRVSPSGNLLASFSWDTSIRIWN